jgi:hypothetical protein
MHILILIKKGNNVIEKTYLLINYNKGSTVHWIWYMNTAYPFIYWLPTTLDFDSVHFDFIDPASFKWWNKRRAYKYC